MRIPNVKSGLFKDSFWSVFGNGLGNVCLLISGIIIARVLGKEVYGEYGMVKTTMFYLAAFATFGLGTTSTKYVARLEKTEYGYLRSVTKSVLKITLLFSSSLCILLFLTARPLANYLKAPDLSVAFEFLGIIIVLRAMSSSCAGLLAGYKLFKPLGINNIIAGVVMLVISYPMTLVWGVYGALMSLLISQLGLFFLNIYAIYNKVSQLTDQVKKSFTKELTSFSFPIALQDLSYTACHWILLLILTKFSSYGEVGLFTVASQWNSIVLFIPTLLVNVVLSYLSSSTNTGEQKNVINKMVMVNLFCSVIPFVIVFAFSGLIVSFYGPTFSSLGTVMNVYLFSTIFMCVSHVFASNMISEGKNWRLFFYRVFRDVLTIIVFYFFIIETQGKSASTLLVTVLLIAHILYFICLIIDYYSKKLSIKNNL